MAKKEKKGKKGGGKGKASGPTAEEKVKQLMERLREEQKLSIVSIQKLNFDRMTMLRKKLKEELRKDITLSHEIFDKVYKIKDNIIESLAGDLKNSEEQAHQAQISHVQFQDRLQTLQVKRLAALDKLWRGGQLELSGEFNSERDEMLVEHQEEVHYLKEVSLVMKKRDYDLRFDALLNWKSLTNALQRLQITKRDLAAKQLIEEEKKKKEGQDKQDEDTYAKAEAEFKVSLKAMEDRCCTKKILIQGRKLRKLQTLRDTMVLQAGAGDHGNQRELETTEMRANVKRVAMKATHIKVVMNRERMAARRRLTTLVMNTSAADKTLRDTRTKGERLLFRFQMCAKIDSEQVKILPSSSKEEGAHATEPPPREIAEAMAEYRELEQFWQRYNKVRLEQLYLKQQEIALTRENKDLHAFVRHYTDFF